MRRKGGDDTPLSAQPPPSTGSGRTEKPLRKVYSAVRTVGVKRIPTILDVLPHDPSGMTQGLCVHDSALA